MHFLPGYCKVVPHIFIGFGIVNLINTLIFRSHKNLTITYNTISILGLSCAIVITLFTGGINSPFIFVLAIVVFAGYATTRRYGKIYLYISILIIVLIYLQGITSSSISQNVVPPQSQDLFSFLSVFFQYIF